jgi:response regulator RpfG family c-di-GMP phosphodiesterase
MIKEESGKHFDPKIVQIFIEISDIVWDSIKDHMEE